MSTPTMRKVNIPPEAKAALEKNGAVKFDKPLSTKTIQIIRRVVAREVFGPAMKPTFRQQLLAFVSFAAIKAGWAASWWQLKMKEKYG